MSTSDSLRLDAHLARLLAAYDPGLGGADGHAPTLDLPASPDPDDRPVNLGSASDLLPDSDPPTPYPAAAVPSAPHRIGRFELRRQLGKGGCGIVFLAYDPQLGREVAVKVPRPEMLMSPDARRRLVREARAAAEFDHPNLVPVYETGEIGPVCYLATAYCPGQTLAEWLDRQAFPVPTRQAARLVAQLAEAVQHAHDRGVLHRDLKPNNVILQEPKADPNTPDGGPPPGAVHLRGDHFVPRLLDFGLAKLDEAGPGETATRQILGTPKYMAPEQAQGLHADVGPGADVYALGAILYELVAGRAPYDGATDVEVLRQVVDGNLTHPRGLRPDLHRDLEAICLKAMAKTPGRRYRTAIDLADDLRRFLDGRPTLARPLTRVGRAARWLRRNDGAVAVGVLAAIAVMFLLIGVWQGLETRLLRAGRDTFLAEQAERARADRRRDYARHVRDAFFAWQAGDARQMADSLEAARASGMPDGDEPDLPWGYLSGLGRVERLAIPAPGNGVLALAAAPAGPRLATTHPDGTLAVWDRQSGARVGSVKADPREVSFVGFVDGGRGLVTAGPAGPPRRWGFDPAGTPTQGPAFDPLPGGTTALAVSADGARVYGGTADGRCGCWDAAGKLLTSWAAADKPVTAVAVSPTGAFVATAAGAGPVRVWAPDGEPTADLPGAGATALAFLPADPAGWLLAVGGADGAVRLVAPDGRDVRLYGHTGPVLALAAGPGGATLASAGEDAAVRVWDIPTESIRVLLRGHDDRVLAVAVGTDGRAVVSGSDDGTVRVWDLAANPQGPALRGLSAAVTAVAVRPDGPGFAAAFADGRVVKYASPGEVERTYPPREGNHRTQFARLAYTADGGPLLGLEVTSLGVEVWAFGGARHGPEYRAGGSPGTTVTAADLAAAAGRVAVGDSGGRVTVCSLDDSNPVAGFDTLLGGPVRHVFLSDDGRWVAAPMVGNQIGVWEVGSGRAAVRVGGYGDAPWVGRFTPAGDRLVTAGKSSIKVWRTADGREEFALRGHVDRVTGLAVSPDGRTLVSGSQSGEVKLWDLRTGQELVGLPRHTGPVRGAGVGADGRLLVTGAGVAGGKGELAFWPADR